MALILKKYPFRSMALVPFLLSVLFLIVVAFFPGNNLGKASANETKRWKILHIMSYHSPWKWTDGQFNGFQAALQGLDIDYKVFQMDTKRHSDPAWKENAGRQARKLIDTWKPDLVYTSDDYAQESVAKYYLNKDLPFVFSGVNADPSHYGFLGSKNITGVLEEEHFVESVQLLKKLVPTVKKIAVLYDDDPTWPAVLARMKKNLAQLPDIQIVIYDLIHTFKQFQEKLAALPQEADAVCLLGIFTFKDEHGRNVSYKEVLRWFLKHSLLPDFSFWQDRVHYGTLCSVNVSEYEQGLAAGRLARGILLEGRSPSSYPMEPTVKGVPMINLPRARQLGINIKTSILLTATVVNEIKTD
jgi:ABC-type uncharacterized transport system substrate-binding protein